MHKHSVMRIRAEIQCLFHISEKRVCRRRVRLVQLLMDVDDRHLTLCVCLCVCVFLCVCVCVCVWVLWCVVCVCVYVYRCNSVVVRDVCVLELFFCVVVF